MSSRIRWRPPAALFAAVAVVAQTAAGAEPKHVHLELREEADVTVAMATNLIAGPVGVKVSFSARENIDADPPLPLRRTIEAGKTVLLARFVSVDPSQPASFGVRMQSVPGVLDATLSAEPFRLPVDPSAQWRIDQGFNGAFSHNDAQSRYAIDITVDEGTPVLAARDGTVMEVDDSHAAGGADRERYLAEGNRIRIAHDDGSMSVYAHLRQHSARVSPGERVTAGTRIAEAGATGFATGPHLHFAVQVNRDMTLTSVPFAMVGPNGTAIPIRDDGAPPATP